MQIQNNREETLVRKLRISVDLASLLILFFFSENEGRRKPGDCRLVAYNLVEVSCALWEKGRQEGWGWRIYHVFVSVANCENTQDKDERWARRRAGRSFRTETYDIGFYARNNASAPAVGVVHSRKT